VSEPISGPTIITIDPGREKCGVAVVSARGELIEKAVVPVEGVTGALRQFLASHPAAQLVVGDSTGSRDVCRRIEAEFPDRPVERVSEYRSTERALSRWRDTVRPTGWQRFLPRPLRFPRQPIDDFAAWILAEDWLNRA